MITKNVNLKPKIKEFKPQRRKKDSQPPIKTNTVGQQNQNWPKRQTSKCDNILSTHKLPFCHSIDQRTKTRSPKYLLLEGISNNNKRKKDTEKES